MSEKTSPKEECKNGKPSKTVGATKEEASTTSQTCRGIANNPEASPELRARAAELANELASPLTASDTARREALMVKAALLLNQGAS